MHLEAITAELRPRNAWEATDLGMALVRHSFRPVYAAWFSVAAPLFALLHLLCWGNWWLIPWLLWWIKPLLDRAPLYVLGHALFGPPPDRRQFWRDLAGLLRRQVFAALIGRRFDLARSFSLPVGQLEQLAGKAYRQRLRDLGQTGRGAAMWLTVICLHLEIALDLALLTLAWMLTPDFVTLEFLDLLDDSDELGQLWLNLVGFCGLSLVEPFYVAAGFALYLNRRTWLEAWDLELGFRRLAARLATSGQVVSSLAVLMVGLSLLGTSVASFATQTSEPAQDSAPITVQSFPSLCHQRRDREAQLAGADSAIKRALADTLREPELQVCAWRESWRFRDDEPDLADLADSRDDGLAHWFAATVEYLLWFALGVTLALIGWWLWRKAPRPSTLPKRRTMTAGNTPLDGRNEVIPPPDPGLAETAWQLWNNGQARESLRLLYQASLGGLVVQYGVPLRSSVTEEECLRLAATHLTDTELNGFLRQLTRAWQATAYAHRPPDDASARTLCEQWSRHFARSGESPA